MVKRESFQVLITLPKKCIAEILPSGLSSRRQAYLEPLGKLTQMQVAHWHLFVTAQRASC